MYHGLQACRALLPLAMTLARAGCGSAEGLSEALVSRVDSMGVEMVVNHRPDQPLAWTLRESWRAGWSSGPIR
jgi:hypothetical protein